mmetsp:Transcript_11973/g.25886  ORF Transcript_11973/g.25886 Transcript_11973/m.25886 type:complete len:225 (-) Transcript_11973:630-1304(-)
MHARRGKSLNIAARRDRYDRHQPSRDYPAYHAHIASLRNVGHLPNLTTTKIAWRHATPMPRLIAAVVMSWSLRDRPPRTKHVAQLPIRYAGKLSQPGHGVAASEVKCLCLNLCHPEAICEQFMCWHQLPACADGCRLNHVWAAGRLELASLVERLQQIVVRGAVRRPLEVVVKLVVELRRVEGELVAVHDEDRAVGERVLLVAAALDQPHRRLLGGGDNRRVVR